MSIDKSKIVEWIENEKFNILKCLHDFNQPVLIKLNDLLDSINSGEFDGEVVKKEHMTYKERMSYRDAIEKVNGSQRAYKN